jgi:dsDNA-binding SOS-regulon protein
LDNTEGRGIQVSVITKYIVVRDGVELDQVFADKKEAEAYDKMLDAAQDLAALIMQGGLQINIDNRTIEEISVYLAKNAPEVAKILKSVKPVKPASGSVLKASPVEKEPVEGNKVAQEPKSKPKGKSRAN